MYRYILCESCSQFDLPALIYFTKKVGALLYEAAIGRAAVLRPGEIAVGVPTEARRPATRGGIGERLCGLLAALLARDPERRLRASEALGHPYFAVSLAPALFEGKCFKHCLCQVGNSYRYMFMRILLTI